MAVDQDTRKAIMPSSVKRSRHRHGAGPARFSPQVEPAPLPPAVSSSRPASSELPLSTVLQAQWRKKWLVALPIQAREESSRISPASPSADAPASLANISRAKAVLAGVDVGKILGPRLVAACLGMGEQSLLQRDPSAMALAFVKFITTKWVASTLRDAAREYDKLLAFR
mmetsp:Transcript_59309/g.145626  ORF Transcript_59309/g.145626 Transcript_59309/m.145626 type:complete len:170 (-) Transcript_59309:176-685(-)